MAFFRLGGMYDTTNNNVIFNRYKLDSTVGSGDGFYTDGNCTYMYIEGYGNSAHTSNYSSLYGFDNRLSSSDCSHVDGSYNMVVSSDCSHCSGGYNVISGATAGFAVGRNTYVTGNYGFAGGGQCTASAMASAAIGSGCTASGKFSMAHGAQCKATAMSAHSHGYGCTASGMYSHAHGSGCTASGNYSHAQGCGCTAYGVCSFASGNGSYAGGICSVAIGDHASAVTAYTLGVGPYNNPGASTLGKVFTVGKGTSASSKSNSLSVTSAGTMNVLYSNITNGADYAEMFEWADGNPNNEDRVGYFVKLVNDGKIEIANSGDEPLGIISGQPSIIGDYGGYKWHKKFEKDSFGRFLTKEYTDVLEIGEDENGKIQYETIVSPNKILSSEYDENKTYISRIDRPEWDSVGLLGKLIVRDDGTCQVGGKCTIADGGIATAGNDYYVIKRISDNVITVLTGF